jgi:cyclopropane-fatty-acyl-phospholipid synthase
MFSLFSDRGRLANLRAVLAEVGQRVQSRISVRLWDGSVVPMGPDADPNVCLRLGSSGVVSSLLRRPTLDNFLRHWTTGRIDIEGADLHTFTEMARVPGSGGKLRGLSKAWVAWKMMPFLLHRADDSTLTYRYADEAGMKETEGRKNKDFVQFHYDVSNEFYQLFLGPHMQYTCNYFTDWGHTTEQAQTDKMEMICRKLRLKPGETLLDIGCGWAGLVCYAAQHYGVKAHGITLSERQLELGRERVRRMGLEGRVTLEMRDAFEMEGKYDKVASIGMIEHIGLANYPRFLQKIYDVVEDRGVVLIQMIARGAKRTKKGFLKSRPEHRLIRKYIFPGGELAHVGELAAVMEAARFEVHDIEGWREHYALTLKQWSQNLAAREGEAIRLVGAERYRMWMAYMVGMSFGFADGTLRLFQVVGSKHSAKGASAMPSTRADLYERPMPSAAMRHAA